MITKENFELEYVDDFNKDKRKSNLFLNDTKSSKIEEILSDKFTLKNDLMNLLKKLYNKDLTLIDEDLIEENTKNAFDGKIFFILKIKFFSE